MPGNSSSDGKKKRRLNAQNNLHPHKTLANKTKNLLMNLVKNDGKPLSRKGSEKGGSSIERN